MVDVTVGVMNIKSFELEVAFIDMLYQPKQAVYKIERLGGNRLYVQMYIDRESFEKGGKQNENSKDALPR